MRRIPETNRRVTIKRVLGVEQNLFCFNFDWPKIQQFFFKIFISHMHGDGRALESRCLCKFMQMNRQ